MAAKENHPTGTHTLEAGMQLQQAGNYSSMQPLGLGPTHQLSKLWASMQG